MNKIMLILFLLLASRLYLFSAICKDDSVETSKQEEICEAKVVTACLIVNDCVYKYNGKEYPIEDVDQVAEDLGCATKSGGYECDMAKIISRLQKLMDKAHKGK